MDDGAGDVGEAEVAALEAVGEFFMIEAEAVQNGGLEVVDMHGIFDDAVAEVIGFSIGDAGLDPIAADPRAFSRALSSAACDGRIKGQPGLILSRS